MNSMLYVIVSLAIFAHHFKSLIQTLLTYEVCLKVKCIIFV